MVSLPLFLLFFSPTAPTELQRFEYAQPHMGTTFRITLYAPDKASADKAASAAFARVEKLNNIFSDYSPTSEAMLLCKKSAEKAGEPVAVSEELFGVLEKAREVSKLSDGAFDVTVGPVVQLWRLARKTERLPDPVELKAALAKVGYEHIDLDPKGRKVTLKVPGMLLDFGGIVKGYAADEALRVMGKQGIHSALVAAGGDIAVGDAPPDALAWKVEIVPLRGVKDATKRTLKLVNMAVSTSGDANQGVTIDGVRYSHIVDPRTGMGLKGQRSVTVIARHGIDSDSLTKLASILPPEKAIPILEKRQVESLIIYGTDAGEKVHQSSKFTTYEVGP